MYPASDLQFSHSFLCFFLHRFRLLQELSILELFDRKFSLVPFDVRLEDGGSGVAFPAELANPLLLPFIVERPHMAFERLLRRQLAAANSARVFDFQMYSLIV